MIGLVELVATYPDEMQDAFADIRKGISSRTKFLPTAAEFVAMGDEIEAYKAKWAVPSRPVREPDTEEYNPSVVPQYFDKRGNRMTEREFMVHAEQVYASKRIQQEQDRMQAYAKHIGNGSTERGWKIMMDMGMTAVPADFVPPVKEEAQ